MSADLRAMFSPIPDPTAEEQQYAAEITRNCLFLFPELTGVIIITNNLTTSQGIEQTAYILDANPTYPVGPPTAPRFPPPPPPLTLFLLPPPSPIWDLFTPPPSTIPSLDMGPLLDHPTTPKYSNSPPQPVEPSLPSPVHLPSRPPPKLKYPHQKPSHLQLPCQSIHRVLLSFTSPPGSSLRGMVSKTTQMLREKLGAFEGYAEGRGWGWCSCPRGWHKEVYFTEAETEGIRRRCRRRTDSDYGTTGGGAEFVEEYDVKSGLGYSNWLGVVVDQGEVVYPVLGAFGGWGNGVVLNGAELV